MKKKNLSKTTNNILSKWVILAIDVFIVVISVYIAFLLRFNFYIKPPFNKYAIPISLFIGVISALTFMYFKTYKGIVRHTGIEDILLIIKSMFFIAIIAESINLAVFYFCNYKNYFIPISVLLIFLILSTLFLIIFRIFVKLIFNLITLQGGVQKRILIYGAGRSGIIVHNVLINSNLRIKIFGFIDNDPNKIGKYIDGICVYDSKILNQEFIDTNAIKEIIFSINNIAPTNKYEIINQLFNFKRIVIKDIPPAESWINAELTFGQIENLKIEDLLYRDKIILDNTLIKEYIDGKVVLITGAAGSIGSEIARQICEFNAKKTILLDQAETQLFDLENEIKERYLYKILSIDFQIADIVDKDIMRQIFELYKPDIVFHAAAYKHVPMMELNPFAAVSTNVLGTKIVADLSSEFGTEKFVLISTDKAIKPTNVMGATKRLAETYCQSINFNQNNKTNFVITRFGNVLGSNGSVIPFFKKQILKGGPVTVTHPDIIRYFMTIPEACQLVLYAGSIGKGGEVLLFDMGKPVKIVDLAKKMIKLSGFTPDEDIKIIYTGLRPGEKLYEELLYDSESSLPTTHPKITIAKVTPLKYESVALHIEQLLLAYKEYDNYKLIKNIKNIVPEYISKNSIYETLDK